MDENAYENDTAEAHAGARVWFGKEDKQNIFLRLPGPNQTNNVAEIRAILERVLATVKSDEIMTIMDSKYVIESLCFHLKHWEDSSWVGVSNSDIWRVTVTALC